MSDQIKKVAMRLADLREIEGLTTEQMSEKFNVSKETYESYESGEVDIPVSFLYAVAGTLKVELADLLSGDAPRLKIYQYVKNGKGFKVERSKQYDYLHLAYNFAHKKAEPFLVTVSAAKENEPISTNSHPGQEFDYCLSGKILININNTDITLEEGDSIFYDSSYPHGMKALGGKDAKFLAIIF
ncbi:MAG: XRE family transcriptional regulator [Clostridia bacterium]|nr:XRE family transcriptional regulator [Clostridia bacterium]